MPLRFNRFQPQPIGSNYSYFIFIFLFLYVGGPLVSIPRPLLNILMTTKRNVQRLYAPILYFFLPFLFHMMYAGFPTWLRVYTTWINISWWCYRSADTKVGVVKKWVWLAYGWGVHGPHIYILLYNRFIWQTQPPNEVHPGLKRGVNNFEKRCTGFWIF